MTEMNFGEKKGRYIIQIHFIMQNCICLIAWENTIYSE